MATTPLAHQFLLAMPQLEDEIFEGSVIYLWQHDDEGSRGLMVNQPSDLRVEQLFQNMSMTAPLLRDTALELVFRGGPVQTERGYILHTEVLLPSDDPQVAVDEAVILQSAFASSQNAGHGLQLTVSKDVLEAMAEGAGPAHVLMALGYCAWSEGQLTQELAQNHWLTVQASREQAIVWLFQTPANQRYATILASLGLQPWQLAVTAGRA